MKNPLSNIGEITKEDIKNTQDHIEEIHQSFIEFCRIQRPQLNPNVCDGRVLSGKKALENGVIDRIVTSDEYIIEKISDGDLVMKVHLISGKSDRFNFYRALELLPHIKRKARNVFSGAWIKTYPPVTCVDGNLTNKIMQFIGLAYMICRLL